MKQVLLHMNYGNSSYKNAIQPLIPASLHHLMWHQVLVSTVGSRVSMGELPSLSMFLQHARTLTTAG